GVGGARVGGTRECGWGGWGGPHRTGWGPPPMPEPESFVELGRRVRTGDPVAAAELVRRYEPAIRRVVRVRLGGGRVAALFDSMDVCQSVLGSFFLRAAAGQYTLDTPEDLLRLLTAMARNKLAFQVRKQRAQKRDCNRDMPGELVAEG